jgi:chaperone required for assembly of F1-ATPase
MSEEWQDYPVYDIDDFSIQDGLMINAVLKNHSLLQFGINEIIKITAVKTDQISFFDDVILYLYHAENNIYIVHSESENYNDLFKIISAFEGFNFDNYLKAVQSVESGEFICWEKKNGAE